MRCLIAGIALSFSLLPACLWAQGTDAVATGTVLDPSGAAVVNATVSMQNVATGVVTTTRTNDVGIYLFAALPPGTYRLLVEHGGFQKYANEGIVLEVGSRLNINVPLAIGSTNETVEVSARAEALETNTSTVGAVVTNEKLLDLPLVGRSAYDLMTLQAGVAGDNGQNVNGARAGMLNLVLDGMNIRNTYLDALVNATQLMTISVDRVQEFRMITSPADAEYGRGAGQLIAVSRTGTNQFHGALFEENRVSALSSNTWFNNQRGTDPTTGQPYSPVNFLEKNQFGGRIGGPIRRNKTFFNINYEGSRELDKAASTSLVYTALARQGIFRFYPGARNANAIAAVPTVDLNGNPIAPGGATGPLQSVTLFGRDPNRMAADPSGIIAHEFGYMPLPNNFRVGDGLNTAGYTWRQRASYDTDAGDLRLDHIINDSHRLGFSYSRQQSAGLNYLGAQVQNFPTAPSYTNAGDTRLWSLSVTSVLRPTLLNEFRAGVFRPSRESPSVWSQDPNFLPQAKSGIAFVPRFTNISDPVTGTAYGNTDGQGHITPGYQFGDNMTWLKGRHSFKGGFEFRFNSETDWSGYVTVPRAVLGASTIPVQNVNATSIPGLGTNQAVAQQMLAELSGSVQNAVMYLNSAGGSNPVYIPGMQQYHHYRSPEFNWFFKDDLKLRPNLTLNLGVRYEWYGVPVEVNGMGLGLVGGEAGVFGISGGNIGTLFQPGLAQGSLTQVQQIGPHTPNPDTQFYNNNNHNFAPAVGVTWAVPGNTFLFGKGKTVLRAGFMMNYQNLSYALMTDLNGGPGYTNAPSYVPSTITTVGNLQLPLTPTAAPLATVPLTDRNSTLWGVNNHLKTGYYQNWNFSIQRALAANLVLEARYVGTKGVNLVRAANMNEVNIFENGILDAFQITQAGGNAPLFDRIFMGIGGVNGTTTTGSDFLRSNATTSAYLAQNNPGALAGFLNTNTLAGKPGDLLRRAGLPENFVVVNPQFGSDWFVSNFGNSFYNALQLELNKRFARGWTLQTNYSWSKALGDEPSYVGGYNVNFRTLRNRRLDKRILDFNRSHVLRLNTIWELPFGPGRLLGRDSHGMLARVIGGWQAGAILTIQSGAPMSLYGANAYNATVNAADTPATPIAVGPLPQGQVRETGIGVVYFTGLRQVPDPSTAKMTAGLRSQSTLLAIADASSQLLLVNATPGQFGNIAPNSLTGPGLFDLDLNLMKRIKIRERQEFVIRCDAVNSTNTPSFGIPNTVISNPNFANITSTVSGPRIIVFGGRFNF